MNRLMRLLATLVAVFAFSALTTAQTPSGENGQTLYSGTLWQKKSNSVLGTYRIIERKDGSQVLELEDDFKTKAGPDLKLVLSPLQPDKVTRKNALTGGLVLGTLRSEKGGQVFGIPASTDLKRFQTLAIHCENYTKLWGVVALTPGDVVASGNKWTKKTKKSSGGFEIVDRDGELLIRFSYDFKTSKPPEPLRILLSTQTSKDASNKNAEDGAVLIAELKSIKGAQEYRLPKGIDLTNYQSILLHCRKYTKLWSASSLQVADK